MLLIIIDLYGIGYLFIINRCRTCCGLRRFERAGWPFVDYYTVIKPRLLHDYYMIIACLLHDYFLSSDERFMLNLV